MVMKTSEISLTIVFSSLYAVLIIVLAPISYGPIQLRVADCLIPLAALFGWPAIAGVTVGCFLGNAYFWMGPQDVILGTIANLIAATIIFMLRKRPFMACVVGSLPIGVIVGGYLWMFFPPPEIFGLQLPIWAAMIVSITISTLIAVAGMGYTILKTLSHSSVVTSLKSRGLKLYLKNETVT
ncbi:MAG: hypothetical protein CW691_00045 [Candidatus Bathyarchaeum sp.]|nr:MAG: hypothetical protein CW691_00045 [Candidatus Bathyarchaeum sp.]